MCGIAGFHGFRDDNLIKQLSKDLAHRGPDGEGFYVEDKISLLNRRLAIIDRKGGDQPIYNEDRSIVVVYNGEIYNYQELRLQLEKKGHTFGTKSDTEVIVHGYEEWGGRCFDLFNGMFAIALYDKKREKLILARDHFGIKPLYYAFPNASTLTSQVRGGLMFCSEIKPIIYSGLVKKDPNDRTIYRYLKYRVHDDTNETFFKGVYKLMPGEMMVIGQKSKVKSQKFTNLEQELQRTTHFKGVTEEAVRVFEKMLIDAVRMRLTSEVPVGTCLSGGLDSSTVAVIVNKLLKQKVAEVSSVGKIQKTFSAVFPGSTNDEEKYINELVKSLKSKVQSHRIEPTPEEFFKDMQDFVRTQEEPTISTGPYAQYKVMQRVQEHVTVVLDGQGSDEMMAGYIPYYFVYLRELWKKGSFLRLIREFLYSFDVMSIQLINRLYIILGLRKEIKINALLNSKFNSQFSNETFFPTKDNLKKRLIEDIFYNSLPSLLRYEDRNSMRFSIEGRVPFLDFNLLKYLFSLNTNAIIRKGWNKYILRESTKDLLPDLINKRRNKIGFTTPEHEWFLRMKNKIYSVFLSESFSQRKYFNQQEVLKAFQLFIEGKTDDTMVFWRLLNVELWLREFIDVKKIKELTSLRVNELDPNEGKKLEVEVDGKTYYRFPIKTDLFKKGDDYIKKISEQTIQSINRLYIEKKWKELRGKKFFVVISEKIVAIAQGRSYFIWDIKPTFWAKILSKFVKRTPFGIGLGSPWTMELAIGEVGAVRVIGAAFTAAIAKLFGITGVFYRITGDTVRSIDGPTEYSLYPSNVSAKLGPEEPQRVARQIHEQLILNFKFKILNFQGVAIIDANDLGRNVLGNSTGLPNSLIEKIFVDNPMGQSNEQTPLVLVIEDK